MSTAPALAPDMEVNLDLEPPSRHNPTNNIKGYPFKGHNALVNIYGTNPRYDLAIIPPSYTNVTSDIICNNGISSPPKPVTNPETAIFRDLDPQEYLLMG